VVRVAAAESDAYGFRFVFDAPWIDSLGVRYIVGVDGISMLLVLLTTVLGFLAILSSWSAIRTRENQYYAYLLILQTGMVGVFVSLDTFLFYVFWEFMLIPMYFLIGSGRTATDLRVRQVFPLHAARIRPDADRYHRALCASRGVDRSLHVRHPCPAGHGAWPDWAVLQRGVARVFSRLRDQGAMFPFTPGSRRARRGADGGSVILAGVLLKMESTAS